jgi:predicted CXXCH cytochrome family protein
MHNSLEGSTMPVTGGGTQFQAPGFLLQGGGTQSDACLVCHSGPTISSYHVDTDTVTTAAGSGLPVNMTPGGDFSWLKPNTEGKSQRRGHNVMATSHGYVADAEFATLSPGGTYPAASFHCSSCHDPHGKYRTLSDGTVATTGAPIISSGSYGTTVAPAAGQAVGVYRLLGGAGYKPKSLAAGDPAFGAAVNPPVAFAPSSYNRQETNGVQTRVAYGSGMSEWCANCHGELLENAYVSGEAAHTHPAGNSAVLGATIAGNYNNYVATGNTAAANYLSLVPFEEGASVTVAALKAKAVNGVSAADATATSNVNCLSCHRAHASGFASMLRYNPATFMTVADGSYAGAALTASNAWNTAAYYGRASTEFPAFQRALCNKCHAKD